IDRVYTWPSEGAGAFHAKRVVEGAEISRLMYLDEKGNTHRVRRDMDIGEHGAAVRAPQFGHDGADRRMCGREIATLIVPRSNGTRLYPVHPLGVLIGTVVERTDNRQAIHDARLARHQFANLNARPVRLDGPIGPAIFRRSGWLQVIHVEMTRSAAQPNLNYRRVAARSAHLRGFGTLPEQSREAQGTRHS